MGKMLNKKIALAEAKRDNHEQLTKADKIWLHSKDKHNYAITSVRTPLVAYMALKQLWTGTVKTATKNEYEYFETPKYNEKMAS